MTCCASRSGIHGFPAVPQWDRCAPASDVSCRCGISCQCRARTNPLRGRQIPPAAPRKRTISSARRELSSLITLGIRPSRGQGSFSAFVAGQRGTHHTTCQSDGEINLAKFFSRANCASLGESLLRSNWASVRAEASCSKCYPAIGRANLFRNAILHFER